MGKAKLFWIGRSQAVRLPKEFRYEGEEVRIRRCGAAVILEPILVGWTWLDELSGAVDADFAEAASGQPDVATLPDLDHLFPE